MNPASFFLTPKRKSECPTQSTINDRVAGELAGVDLRLCHIILDAALAAPKAMAAGQATTVTTVDTLAAGRADLSAVTVPLDSDPAVDPFMVI